MSDSNQNVRLNIQAGDTSGLRQVAEELKSVQQATVQAMNAFRQTPEQRQQVEGIRLERERVRAEAAAAGIDRENARLAVEQARLAHTEAAGVNAAAARQHGLEQQGRMTRFGAITGAGSLGAATMNAAGTGNFTGVIGSMGMLGRMNPWVLAGSAVAAAGSALGFSKAGDNTETMAGYLDAAAGLYPYSSPAARAAMQHALTNPEALKSFAAAGYRPSEALQRITAYERTAGLGGRGLNPLDILTLERTRGISAEVSGAFSSMYAPGGGAVGDVTGALKSAIAEGTATGMRYAMPRFLEGLSGAMTRYSGLGLDTTADAILSVLSGMRNAGGSLFKGTRGLEALGKFQSAGDGALGLLKAQLPTQAMQSMMVARALQATGGDPGAAMGLLEQWNADGTIVGQYRSIAGQMGPIGPATMAALTGVSYRQSRAMGRYRRGAVGSEGFGGDDDGWLDTMMRYRRHQAWMDARRIGAGYRDLDTTIAKERAAEGFTQGAAGVTNTALSWIFGTDANAGDMGLGSGGYDWLGRPAGFRAPQRVSRWDVGRIDMGWLDSIINRPMPTQLPTGPRVFDPTYNPLEQFYPGGDRTIRVRIDDARLGILRDEINKGSP